MTKPEENLVLIFYVGTRHLVGLLAETSAGEGRVLRSAEISHAEGFQKGGVTQLEKALTSFEELIRRLEIGEEVYEIPVYVVLSTPLLRMSRYSSSIYYSGYPRTLTSREVAQGVEQTRNVAPLALDQWILHVEPESFWVNDLTGVQDPVGLEAQRLAVTLQIYSVDYTFFRNLSRVFESLEFNLKGYYPKPFLLPEGVLSESEKQGEALIMDFSDEATHLILTREGRITETKSLDLGSRFLTQRVAETWQMGWRDAERLKERFGSLETHAPHRDELVPLTEHEGQAKSHNHQIKRSEFHASFLRFGGELFDRLAKEIKGFLTDARLVNPAFVLTGGGARLEGVLDFLAERLGSPVRLGTPRPLEGNIPQSMNDPAWAAPIGAVRWLAGKTKSLDPVSAKENLLEKAFEQAKGWFAAYF